VSIWWRKLLTFSFGSGWRSEVTLAVSLLAKFRIVWMTNTTVGCNVQLENISSRSEDPQQWCPVAPSAGQLRHLVHGDWFESVPPPCIARRRGNQQVDKFRSTAQSVKRPIDVTGVTCVISDWRCCGRSVVFSPAVFGGSLLYIITHTIIHKHFMIYIYTRMWSNECHRRSENRRVMWKNQPSSSVHKNYLKKLPKNSTVWAKPNVFPIAHRDIFIYLKNNRRIWRRPLKLQININTKKHVKNRNI